MLISENRRKPMQITWLAIDEERIHAQIFIYSGRKENICYEFLYSHPQEHFWKNSFQVVFVFHEIIIILYEY